MRRETLRTVVLAIMLAAAFRSAAATNETEVEAHSLLDAALAKGTAALKALHDNGLDPTKPGLGR